ncbi:hypothetical protein [Streptomyces brasiliensis]|uniref:Lipoprotein n=1 Tax=Streptomyces brasiliensis TaxID=1954 RepID=A0A917NFW0_9ACTN|nr:hypothetical protein [Streptomyces brasiliensis]GGI97384.1 hypothetical protein GCM10010121_004560 [Streptomyces brasiliensis]
MRAALVAVAVLAVVTAVACDGEGNRAGLVVEGTPPATPYSGPLDVPTKFLDENTPAALRTESGAAGRALECDGEIYQGSGPDGWSERDGGGSPEEGLNLYFDMFEPGLPERGYRVEREEADRVLYSYDVGGRTKVAVVVAKDQKGRPGWGPETSASCDPAELPASFTDSQGWYEIWTDRAGRRAPVAEISSYPGAEHCDWQQAHFLHLGRGEDERSYARDPDGVLDADTMLTAPYDGDVRMPADAHDTGFRYRNWQLWLTDDSSTAYVRTPDGVEAWPRVRQGTGCR